MCFWSDRCLGRVENSTENIIWHLSNFLQPSMVSIDRCFEKSSSLKSLWSLSSCFMNARNQNWRRVAWSLSRLMWREGWDRAIVEWSTVNSILQTRNKLRLVNQPSLLIAASNVRRPYFTHGSAYMLTTPCFAEKVCKQCCVWSERLILWRHMNVWPKINTGVLWLFLSVDYDNVVSWPL